MDNTHAIGHIIVRSFSHTLPWVRLTWVCLTSIESIQLNILWKIKRNKDQKDLNSVWSGSWSLWELLLLYDKELGRNANKGAWDTPIMIRNQRINLRIYELLNTYALKEKVNERYGIG
jgi:hypothetical protein